MTPILRRALVVTTAHLVVAGLLDAPAARASHGALICLPGGPYIAECSGGEVSLRLDGSASRDPAGRPLLYHWETDCAGARFDNPDLALATLTLPHQAGCESICEVHLEIDNRNGKTDHCEASIVVRDTTPPPPPSGALALVRWPPNHRVECFTAEALGLTGAADDACSAGAPARLTGCRVDEPSRAGACRVSDDGDAVCLRIERNGSGAGRTYHIEAVSEDECGNRSAPAVVATVHIPHDQGD